MLGSLSSLAARRLANYEPLIDWTDDPTDSSLRDVEVSSPPDISLTLSMIELLPF